MLFIELFTGLFTKRFTGLFTGLDDSPSIAFPSAIFAHTINLKSVAGGYVMVLVPNFVFNFPDFLRKKFHRSSAFGAHHMVMTTPVVLMFITRNAIVKGDLASQPAARQKLQSAIDGSEPDARIGLLNQPMQFIDGEMFSRFEEGSKDSVALPSLLQTNAFQMLKKDAFSFADILPRDRQLIVDSLLQHSVQPGEKGVDDPLQMDFMILGEKPLRQPKARERWPVNASLTPSLRYMPKVQPLHAGCHAHRAAPTIFD